MSENKISVADVMKALQSVNDPILGIGLVENDMIRNVQIQDGKIKLALVFLIHGHPGSSAIEKEIKEALSKLEGVEKVDIDKVVEIPKDARLKDLRNGRIKMVIAVASGKGGVGKSTVSVNLAVSLAKMGAKVGLMDADVYGPNIPLMMGVEQLPRQSGEGGIQPAEAYHVRMISIGFMVKPNQPIVWRGPMLHSAIQQFISDVDWGDLDYLIVDLPPGTGDAQLSLAQTISITGGVIVTLPQQVSVDDARRGLEMFRQMDIPILGVVENMSYLELPDGQKMDIFGSGGGEKMARSAQVDFLGAIPIDPAVRQGGDQGRPIVISDPESKVAMALNEIALKTALLSGLVAKKSQGEAVSISIS